MKTVLFIALGGGIGSAARYLMVQLAALLLGPQLPWGTLAVNIVGGFAMGFLAGSFEGRTVSNDLRLFLTTGILGGFTTFSAFSLDTVRLFQSNGALIGGAYVLASVALSIAFLVFGILAARFFLMSAS
jgi:CrcB protein